MASVNEKLINETMKDVINTTKEARAILFNNGQIINRNRDDITVVKTVIEANKNLVSASQTLIKVEQL
jgi:hypothetical protein